MGQLSVEDSGLLYRIQQIRERNNRHWMDIIRVALREAPDETRALLRQIEQCDGEVRRLTQELAGEDRSWAV